MIKAKDEIRPVNHIVGNNTHNLKTASGLLIGRTYVESHFSYNGTKVYHGNKKANARSLFWRYTVDKLGGVSYASYPSEYNGKICRVEYFSSWTKTQPSGSQPVVLDNNRVSCNHLGQIFRSKAPTIYV